jgi:hypothetical protein
MEQKHVFELTTGQVQQLLMAIDAAGRHLGIDAYATLANLAHTIKQAVPPQPEPKGEETNGRSNKGSGPKAKSRA